VENHTVCTIFSAKHDESQDVPNSPYLNGNTPNHGVYSAHEGEDSDSRASRQYANGAVGLGIPQNTDGSKGCAYEERKADQADTSSEGRKA
jgi:hypothetical protein